jgi:hypothetical protein
LGQFKTFSYGPEEKQKTEKLSSIFLDGPIGRPCCYPPLVGKQLRSVLMEDEITVALLTFNTIV